LRSDYCPTTDAERLRLLTYIEQFHDTDAAVDAAWTADRGLLAAEGFVVRPGSTGACWPTCRDWSQVELLPSLPAHTVPL